MLCPACGHDNIAGIDRCEACMAPLMKLDIPQPLSKMHRRLMEDPISVLNPVPAISVPAHSKAAEAVDLMKEKKVGCLLVMEGERVVGIFSERDILNKLAGTNRDVSEVVVREVMTAKPVTFGPSDSINYALHEMSLGGFRHIPVVVNQIPVGIISIRDVLGYLCRIIGDLRKSKSATNIANDHSQ
jgi:CBS domain-containing protein